MKKIARFSVPGSIFLLGEHSILKYNQAIVVAGGGRMFLDIYLSNNNDIKIISEANKSISLNLNDHNIQNNINDKYWLLSHLALKDFKLKNYIFKITSNIKRGLGSSGALFTLLFCSAAYLKSYSINKYIIHRIAKYNINKNNKYKLSGADIIASYCGGISYIKNNLIQKLNSQINLNTYYTNQKISTYKVMKYLEKRWYKKQYEKNQILKNLNTMVNKGKQALIKNNIGNLAKIISQCDKLLNNLGINNQICQYTKMKYHNKLLAMKISGAGLGDNIVALNNGYNLINQNYNIDKDGFIKH